MDSDSDESDLYAALADSERIVNGSVSLDLDAIKSRKSVSSIQTSLASLASLADKESVNHSQPSVSAIKARFERVSTTSISTFSNTTGSNNSTLNARRFSRADKISTPSLLSHTTQQPSPKRQSVSTPDVKNPSPDTLRRGSNARKQSFSENDDYNNNLVTDTTHVPNNTQMHRSLLTSTESLSNLLFDDDPTPTSSHPPPIRQTATTTFKPALSQNLYQTMTPSEEYLFNFMSTASNDPTRIPVNDTFLSTDSVNLAAPIVHSAIRRNTRMDASKRDQSATNRSTGSLYDYDYGHDEESSQAGVFSGESEEKLSESHNSVAVSSVSLNAAARNEYMSNESFKRASMDEPRASLIKIQLHQQSNRGTAASQDTIPERQSHNYSLHLASKQNPISSPSSRNRVSFSHDVGMDRDYQETPLDSVNHQTRDSASFWDIYHHTGADGASGTLNSSTAYLSTAPQIPNSNIDLPQVQIEQYISDKDMVDQQTRSESHPPELHPSQQHHFEEHQNQGLQQVRSSQTREAIQPVTVVPTPNDSALSNANARKINAHQPTNSAPDFSFEKLRASIGTGTPMLRNGITKPAHAPIIYPRTSIAEQQGLPDITIENSETLAFNADNVPIPDQAHPQPANMPAGYTFNNCKFEYALPNASVAPAVHAVPASTIVGLAQ
ncbi:hypothetical protein HDU81_009076, partial [Chytriomyces hyalinus]